MRRWGHVGGAVSVLGVSRSALMYEPGQDRRPSRPLCSTRQPRSIRTRRVVVNSPTQQYGQGAPTSSRALLLTCKRTKPCTPSAAAVMARSNAVRSAEIAASEPSPYVSQIVTVDVISSTALRSRRHGTRSARWPNRSDTGRRSRTGNRAGCGPCTADCMRLGRRRRSQRRASRCTVGIGPLSPVGPLELVVGGEPAHVLAWQPSPNCPVARPPERGVCQVRHALFAVHCHAPCQTVRETIANPPSGSRRMFSRHSARSKAVRGPATTPAERAAASRFAGGTRSA